MTRSPSLCVFFNRVLFDLPFLDEVRDGRFMLMNDQPVLAAKSHTFVCRPVTMTFVPSFPSFS
jgi:hypothetical protein